MKWFKLMLVSLPDKHSGKGEGAVLPLKMALTLRRAARALPPASVCSAFLNVGASSPHSQM